MDDLIRRQDAIDCVSSARPMVIRSRIASLPKVGTAPQWIPISEQMPPQDVEVLATCGGFVTMARYIGDDVWFTCEGNSNATTEEIDAWMSLPKPYEVKQ